MTRWACQTGVTSWAAISASTQTHRYEDNSYYGHQPGHKLTTLHCY